MLAPANDSRWHDVIVATLSALDNRLSDLAASSPKQPRRQSSSSIDIAASIQRVALSAREIDPIVRAGGNQEASIQHAASAFVGGAGAIRIVLIGAAQDGQSRRREELEAVLELLANAVFAEIALADARDSMEFWRTYGRDLIRGAIAAKKELARERDAACAIDVAVGSLRQAPPNDRFARFGELVAAHSGFDNWIVATAETGGLKVAAASPALKTSDLERTRLLLEESFRRRLPIARAVAADAKCPAFVCFPFDAGAIALGAREGASPAARANAEAIVARLGPVVTGFVMELDAANRRGLVQKLALRIFAGIDEERARIARDLHDDQAQLLAAAKIALEGGREEARSIFKQIEIELRRKTRELRPATLGSATLDEAIEREFRRFANAGISAKLVHATAATGLEISRPVQQLCFQMVREALSNVVRHARAKSIEVIVERTGSSARITVSDDGRGIDASGNGHGSGLAGVRERLELMGGSLIVKSRAGRTTVLAEIPEPM